MCGIAGILGSFSEAEAAARVRGMTDAIRLRGPDDAGLHIRSYGPDGFCVGLGHRRLSIIDLSPLGHQPMQSPTGRDVWITFNGEIYNFPELRPQLEARGYVFKSTSDTEAILAAYEEWGAACVERFDGMFAFAIWDGERRTLLLARDRLGKKPLLYWQRGDGIAFASDLTALRTLPGLPTDWDPQALASYFSLGYVTGERSVFAAVRKLLPGHYAVWKDGVLQATQYWDALQPQPVNGRAPVEEPELLDALDRQLREATRKRLMSDVPLGAWLSGGIDSSLVAYYMTAASPRPIRTFTIGFDDAALDESNFARAVAREIGTIHEEFRVTAAETLAMVPEAAACYDEPFADDAGIPTYILSKLSRRHVTVILAGEGGDEGFMGYAHYRLGRLLSLVGMMPDLLRQGLARVGASVGSLRWKARLGAMGYRNLADFYWKSSSLLRDYVVGPVTPFPFDLEGSSLQRVAGMIGPGSPERALTYLDLLVQLPDGFLVKVDRASMANSLEVRAPFLDHKLIEWALSIPQHFKLRDGHNKYILRQLLARKIPRGLIERPKRGFTPPLGRWLREELRDWVRDHLSPRRVAETGVLNPQTVTRVVDWHLAGRAPLGPAVWTLLCFVLWHERVMGRSAKSVAAA